jgi:superfamily II DNA or RNA helicase
MLTLHPFQEDAIEALRQGYRAHHKRQVLALATGAGKTVVASHMIRNASRRGHKSLFIVDRIELVGQAADHLQALRLRTGIPQADNTWMQKDDEVAVASIQTLNARQAPPSGFVIIDECHILHKAHIDLLESWNAVPCIGLSPTPLTAGLGKTFSHLVRGPSIAWLTEHGFLVPARAFCPGEAAMRAILAQVSVRQGDFVTKDLQASLNRNELVGDIVKTWREKGEDRPTLCFAVDIAHLCTGQKIQSGTGVRARPRWSFLARWRAAWASADTWLRSFLFRRQWRR